MRLATKNAAATRGHHLRWMLISAVLGGLLAWLAVGPLSFLRSGNVVLWAAAAIYVAKQRGGHVRKWMRLAMLGFAVGFAFQYFDYSGPDTFTHRLPVLVLFGLGSAVCAVPSGGLIHAVFAWQAHRAAQRQSGN